MVVALDIQTIRACRVEHVVCARPGATPREQMALDKPRDQRTSLDQWAVRRYLAKRYPASFSR